MFGSTQGAQLLAVIRRTAVEDAIPGPMSKASQARFDRACLRAAREAMREFRFQRQTRYGNGLTAKNDPVGVAILSRRLITEAIESRNAYCRANLGASDEQA